MKYRLAKAQWAFSGLKGIPANTRRFAQAHCDSDRRCLGKWQVAGTPCYSCQTLRAPALGVQGAGESSLVALQGGRAFTRQVQGWCVERKARRQHPLNDHWQTVLCTCTCIGMDRHSVQPTSSLQQHEPAETRMATWDARGVCCGHPAQGRRAFPEEAGC